VKSILIYTPEMAAIGGMETHLVELATLLSQNAWAVTMVTTSNSLNDASRQQCVDAGVELVEMPVARTKAGKLAKLRWLLWQAGKLRRKRWDVIYTNGQGSLAAVVWLAARLSTRIIHHHHTSADPDERTTWAASFRWLLKAVPSLIACSEETRANLRRAGCRQQIEKLVYLIPDLGAPATAEAVEDCLGERPLRFGFIGRLVSTKGIDLVVRLSQDPDLREVEWHLHGEGDEASALKPLPNLKFHGPYRGAAALRKIHSGLDAVVLFSRHTEGMPLSLIEAMASGLPWIATDRGGTRELAVSDEDSILLKADFEYDDAKAAVLDLASRLRGGVTSRDTQRAAFERYLNRDTVVAKWLAFFAPPRAEDTSITSISPTGEAA
jgi:glycosyltransferase involved in cell wall biosynthesis